MIISFDTETRGLDATKFILGSIVKQNMKNETFTNKAKMYQRIKEMAKTEERKSHNLYIYGFNARYDTYAIIPPEDLIEINDSPYIAMIKNHKNIRIFDMSKLFTNKENLATLGKRIGYEKSETPEKLYDENSIITFEELQKIRQYCIRDSEIVMKTLQKIREKNKEAGINVRKLITMGQIAKSYMLKELNKTENRKAYFKDDKKRMWDVKNPWKILKANRGARTQAFQQGKFQGIDYIDINSLYPYSATQIEMPNLATEHYIQKPLENYSLRYLLQNIGIMNAMIKIPEARIGFVPIRYQGKQFFPKHESTLIGTWTFLEIREFIEKGAKLLDTEYCIMYKKTENTLKPIIEELYKKKKEGNQEDREYYKLMLNSMLGKLAERKIEKERIRGTIDDRERMLEKGYKVTGARGNELIYTKNLGTRFPSYFAPIIYNNITAKAKLILLEGLEKIGAENIIYTDTDSILYIPSDKELEINIGQEIGQYKKEYENAELQVYGRKMYMINDKIRVSGMDKRLTTKQDFEKGTIYARRIQTLGTAQTMQQIGQFKVLREDITRKIEDDALMELELENEDLIIDTSEKNVDYYFRK